MAFENSKVSFPGGAVDSMGCWHQWACILSVWSRNASLLTDWVLVSRSRVPGPSIAEKDLSDSLAGRAAFLHTPHCDRLSKAVFIVATTCNRRIISHCLIVPLIPTSEYLSVLGFQIWILEILQNIAQVARSAYEILRDYSLLTWILHILEGRSVPLQERCVRKNVG